MAVKSIPYLLSAFLAGVGLRSFFNMPENWILGALGLAVGILFIFYFFKLGSRFLIFNLIFLVFLFGMLRFSIFENNVAKDELRSRYGEILTLSGRIIASEPKPNSARIILETDLGRVLVVSRPYPQYKYGDALEVKGKIEEPENYADFDVKKYLAKDRIYSRMIFPEIKKVDTGKSGVLSALFW